MGRHGGGSRSGGSRGISSSRSSSGSSGSSSRSSKKPFPGCYNRTYYDSKGRCHSYYTTNKNFGTKKGFSPVIIFVLVFITLHMLIMLGSFSTLLINFGKKVDGNPDRIYIEDYADALTYDEEEKLLALLDEVYDISGMPVTVYTDTFDWKEHYDSIEVYSEELYYSIGTEEDAMILLYTTDNDLDFYDYEYDFYCGDDTTSCLSDKSFEKLITNFHKGMSNLNLYDALDYSFHSVMDEMARTTVDWTMLPVLLVLPMVYSIFYIVILSNVRKNNQAYKYFQENPSALSDEPLVLYSTCPNCGASNTEQAEVCPYCKSLLKISDGKIKFVSPSDK